MKAKLLVFMFVMLMTTACMAELAGYWNFDEGTGITAADSSGNGKNGVLSYLGSGSLPAWITGHDGTGYALQFNNGVTTYKNSNRVLVDITTTDYLANLMKTGRAFTISMWVRNDEWTGMNRYPIYTDAYCYWLAVDPTNLTQPGNLYDYFSSGDSKSTDPNAAWYQVNLQYGPVVQSQLNVWYHLALTYDGNFLRRYVNGKFWLVQIPAPINALATATSEFYIGSRDTGRYYFIGALDDVAIWSDTYLTESEIAKLANGTATPLMVTEHAPEAQLPVCDWEREPGMDWQPGVKGKAWRVSGWAAVWTCGFAQDMRLIGNKETGKTAWSAYTQDYTLNVDYEDRWCKKPLLEGQRSPVYTWCHLIPEKFSNDANIYEPNWGGHHQDVNSFGVTWIPRSWDTGDMNGTNHVVTIAGYITPGYAICDGSHDYTAYDPCENRFMPAEDKPYFKTYLRFATENAPAGCRVRIRQYTFPNDSGGVYYHPENDTSCLTYFAELQIPIVVGNYQWQVFKGTLPKPGNKYGRYWDGSYKGILDTVPQALHEPMKRVWFELSIQGGDEDTVLYVDEFAPISDQYIQEGTNTSNYLDGDVNKNSLVYWDDVKAEADNWLSPYNFVDYSDTTGNWLMPLFNSITGDPCDPNW
jgi:hypothetical protein